MDNNLNTWNVSSSPHVRSGVKTRTLMLMVITALLPAALYGVYLFGIRALLLILVCTALSVLSEFVFEKLTKRKVTISDFSAVVTGLLLAMNLPVSFPLWMAALGSVFAIVVVKQFFGGLGNNIMNPALAGRCFLMLSFSSRMTDFAVNQRTAGLIADTVSGATPLAEIKSQGAYDILSMFIGNTKGTIGETSAVLLLAGGLFLVFFKVIDLRVPLTYIGSFALFALLFGGHGFDMRFITAEVFGGGLMLGAWFMATDYVTRPITRSGRYIYGVILGVLTGVFRFAGASSEGVSYAIIFTNLLVPIIEKLTYHSGFGIKKKKAEVKTDE